MNYIFSSWALLGLQFYLMTLFMTLGDANSITFKVLSGQTFWPIFRSVEREIWPLEHPQGIS